MVCDMINLACYIFFWVCSGFKRLQRPYRVLSLYKIKPCLLKAKNMNLSWVIALFTILIPFHSLAFAVSMLSNRNKYVQWLLILTYFLIETIQSTSSILTATLDVKLSKQLKQLNSMVPKWISSAGLPIASVLHGFRMETCYLRVS